MVGFFIEMKNEGNVVFKDSNNRVNVDFFPVVKIEGDYNETDILLAHLLSWLNSFYESLFAVRKEIGLEIPLSYPTQPTIEKVADLILTLKRDKRKVLEFKAKELTQKYHLGTNWIIPMQITVLSHTLLIPHKEAAIKVYIPDYASPLERRFKGLRSIPNGTVIIRDKLMKYPAIYFTRQVSPNEIKKWIDNNVVTIKNAQRGLPTKKDLRRNVRTLFWGQMAWMLKRDGIKSWAKMQKAIDNMDNKNPFISENVDEKIFRIPTANELQKYYNYFIESLQNIEAL